MTFCDFTLQWSEFHLKPELGVRSSVFASGFPRSNISYISATSLNLSIIQHFTIDCLNIRGIIQIYYSNLFTTITWNVTKIKNVTGRSKFWQIVAQCVNKAPLDLLSPQIAFSVLFSLSCPWYKKIWCRAFNKTMTLNRGFFLINKIAQLSKGVAECGNVPTLTKFFSGQYRTPPPPTA